ncbi:MAG: ribonuclease HIII [Candidatus Firestonebacteria bacterium]
MSRIIGVDEAGKGDYFGPLVIAGVFVDSAVEEKLKELKVRDSKLLTDKKALEIALKIKEIAVHSVVVVNPDRYNELYSKIKNLNKLLAWGHARVIENLLEKVECDYAISDKFGEESRIKEALMEKGRKIEMRQETGAEKYLSVAAASVLARAGFLEGLKKLSEEAGMELPKGATHVEEAGRRFIREKGAGALAKFAKVHFKTTKMLLQEKML